MSRKKRKPLEISKETKSNLEVKVDSKDEEVSEVLETENKLENQETKEFEDDITTKELKTTKIKTCSLKFKVIKNKYKPIKATKGSAAYDIKARIDDEPIDLFNKINKINLKQKAHKIIHNKIKTLELKVGDRVKIPTGLFADIPENWEIGIYPRSGLSLKKGLLLVNAPATIDSDYTNEIHVIVQNIGEKSIKIQDSDRIAQIKFLPVSQLEIEYVDEINKETERKGGFGSTGNK